MKKYLVYDIGGSAVKYAIIDENKNFLVKDSYPSSKENFDAFKEGINSVYQKYKEEIDGVALSFAATIDPESHLFICGSAFPFLEGRYAEELFDDLDKKLVIENDANSAAVAELRFGVLRDCKDAFAVILGSAVGGAIILDNKIYHGSHFCAGEFSMIRTDGNDSTLGNLWAFNGGSVGLLKEVQTASGINEKLNGFQIFERQDEEKIMAGINEFARKIAIQLYNLQCVLDVKKVAIGGGISAQPLLIELIDKNLADIYDYERKYHLPPKKPEIVACQYHNDANLLGAYSLLFD